MSAKIKITDKITAGGDKLLVIAGPCVAESLELCLEVAERMSEICAKLKVSYIFKASFDKANRSSAGSFRGLGMEKGLDILAEVKEKLKVPTLTDAHDTSQAELIAQTVDIIQIPAFLCRQTDLISAAAKTGKTVNIKKGQFMAPEDMKGAVEKAKAAGGSKIMLTERGASFGYHNLVVDMRSMPIMRGLGVPVIFDATHSVQLPGGLGHASGGQRQFVRPLARAAAAAGIDGLFLETHPSPDKALSDGPNSVNFQDAETIIYEIKTLHELVKNDFK
jgi:2-dehydro-3-deoxyphosphooctonate aldolase (KDO 8-P synthase)